LKALITADIHPYLQQRLEVLGYNVVVKMEINRAELLDIIADFDMLIITTYTKVDKAVIDKAVQLKVIGRVGSGMENIDISYCHQKNIKCINSPEGNENAVGEHCLAMLLSFMNNINKANTEIKQNIFLREENRGEELDGKTIGIIGYGHTGKAFAKKLRGFDVKILAYDKYQSISDLNVQPVSLQEIQQSADIISFHVPYTSETHHYCNEEFILHCAKTPVIINTSRGAVVDTLAILNALKNAQIKGCCLDVFEDEPITQNKIHPPNIYQEILAFNNVIATPHIAGWTRESKLKLVKILMDKIEAIL